MLSPQSRVGRKSAEGGGGEGNGKSSARVGCFLRAERSPPPPSGGVTRGCRPTRWRVSSRADHGTMRTQRRANFCRGGGGGRSSGSRRCSCSHRSHFHPLFPSTHLRSEGLLELEDLLDVFRLLFPGGAAFAVLPGHGRLVLWGGRGCVGEGAPGARRAGAGGCEVRGCRAGGCGSQGGSGCRRASSSAVSSFALAAAAWVPPWL